MPKYQLMLIHSSKMKVQPNSLCLAPTEAVKFRPEWMVSFKLRGVRTTHPKVFWSLLSTAFT